MTGKELFRMTSIGLSSYGIDKDGNVYSYTSKRYLTHKFHRDGYLFVRLIDDHGESSNYYVHQLVAKMFVDNSDNKPQVDHIDGNKHNNAVSNLRWATNRENAHYAMQHGLMPHAVFMSDDVVHQICKRIASGESVQSISDSTGYSYDAIYAVRMRRNWTHVSQHYVFPKLRNRTVLTLSQVETICRMIVDGASDKDIAESVGTRVANVTNIRIGKNFRHVSCKYF